MSSELLLPISENKNPSRWGTWKRRLSDVSHSSDSWMFLMAQGCSGPWRVVELIFRSRLWDFSSGKNSKLRLPAYCEVGFSRNSRKNLGTSTSIESIVIPCAAGSGTSAPGLVGCDSGTSNLCALRNLLRSLNMQRCLIAQSFSHGSAAP